MGQIEDKERYGNLTPLQERILGFIAFNSLNGNLMQCSETKSKKPGAIASGFFHAPIFPDPYLVAPQPEQRYPVVTVSS